MYYRVINFLKVFEVVSAQFPLNPRERVRCEHGSHIFNSDARKYVIWEYSYVELVLVSPSSKCVNWVDRHFIGQFSLNQVEGMVIASSRSRTGSGMLRSGIE